MNMFICVVLFLLQATAYIQGSIAGTVTLKLTEIGHDFVGKIEVGKDKRQLLDVVFDTGVELAWVVSDEANGNIQLLDHVAVLDTKSMPIPASEKKPCKLSYTTGEVSGYRIKDTLTIKTEPQQITLQNYEFGIATFISENFQSEIFFTHAVSFGLNLVSTEKIQGHFEPAIHKLADVFPTFAFYIDRKNPENNVLVFGEPSPNYFHGPFVSHDVVNVQDGKYDGWNVKIDKIIVEKDGQAGSKSEITPQKEEYGKIVSRSNCVLSGPNQLIKEINEKIFSFGTFNKLEKSDSGFKFRCEKPHEDLPKLPTLKMVIDGQELEFNPADYIIIITEENTCWSALFGDESYYFTIGNFFLEKIFTKFDYTNKKVHFAKAKK